jgi:hypothetical protein
MKFPVIIFLGGLLVGSVVAGVLSMRDASRPGGDVLGPEEDFFISRMMIETVTPEEDPRFFDGVPEELVLEPAAESMGEPVLADVASVDNALCVGQRHDFYCYEDYYDTLVVEKGVVTALTDIKDRYEENSYIHSECHQLMHVIGRAASYLYDNVGEAYKDGDGFCWSGYYHGVLEGVISEVGLQNLTQSLNGLCSDIEGKNFYSFDYYNCVHGLGHGIMAITNTELFDSLAYCDGISGDWEQKSCASGAYMENVIVDGKNHTTKYLRSDEPLYPCSASPEKFKNTCYLMQTSYMLKLAKGDFQQVFDWCEDVEDQYRNTCYTSLGRDASGRTVSDVARTKAYCMLGDEGEQQKYCVLGAVKDFISYFHSDVQAKEFCNAFEDRELVKDCLSTAHTYYQLF